MIPLLAYLQRCKGKPTDIAFIDSAPLKVCHNLRISCHKVFDGLAGRGKSSTGWFYGFKLHLIVNEHGELLSINLTPANMDDRKPVPKMTKGLSGKLFDDKD